MLTAWHTTGFGEVEGSITESNHFGSCLEHTAHGGTASRRQAAPNPHTVSHIVRKEKATKYEILSLSWLTGNQGGKARKNLHFWNVQHSSQDQRAILLHYYTTLTKAFKSDLHWWHFFLNSWNSVSFLECHYPQTSLHCQVATDASGSWFFQPLFEHPGYSYPYTWSQQQLSRYAIKEPSRVF